MTPEPEICTMLLNGAFYLIHRSIDTAQSHTGAEYSHITLVSDGISSVVSDDEIADLTRGAPTPRHAAQRILEFAEEMGGEDNATALIVPLAGWGKITGPDQTREFRNYRQKMLAGNERRRNRWM